jgi:D-tagatose-1,6-bisphosphate aldolase subunit GatZ/KbaZ
MTDKQTSFSHRETASASDALRAIVNRNRSGAQVGTYAVCSAHPAVLDAAIQQALADGSMLHVESTSNQVNQFGGYTGWTPAEFATQIRNAADLAGLNSNRILLGADHLGPYCWRAESASSAMANACELAAHSVLAGYQKIHLDASMACADDPPILPEAVVAERAAAMCRAAEDTFSALPPGSPLPLYVIGTEVPVPGGEVTKGEAPAPTRLEDLEGTLDAFRSAFRTRGLDSAWERVVGIVVQPGVEFGENSIFEYDRKKARHLVEALPASPELVYEAHSTDYQTPASLSSLVQDHFAILKVGPWLTFAFREAVLALSLIESEIPEYKKDASQVRGALESEMLRNPAHWSPYYQGDPERLQFARTYSLSDRCRYYWPQEAVEQQLNRLLSHLNQPLPLALLSQYLPMEYEAIRDGRIDNRARDIIRYHIQRVLRIYASACGALAS